jgi:hypothetical protein
VTRLELENEHETTADVADERRFFRNSFFRANLRMKPQLPDPNSQLPNQKSKKALKIASRRPLLLALIVMATIGIGLLFSGRAQTSRELLGAQSSAQSSSQYNAPDP